MRINPDLTTSVLRALNTARRSESAGLMQLASGRRLHVPSDDPAAAALLVQNAARTSENGEFSKNIKTLRSSLQTADAALSSATIALTRAISLGIEGGNGTQTAEQRRAIAQELRGIRDQIFSTANTTFRGTYLFAGSATDRPAFSHDAIGNVQYDGNDAINQAVVGTNRTVATNIPGDQLFGAAFSAIDALVSSLESNDASAVGAATIATRSAFDHLTTTRVFYGNAISNLDTVSNQVEADTLECEKEEDDLNGADLAQTITTITQAQTATQAILSAAAKISKTSLFDYL